MIDIIVAKQHDAGYRVAEIWSVDMPLCGQTALLNPKGYLYGGFRLPFKADCIRLTRSRQPTKRT